MQDLKFTNNYKNNETLRNSFSSSLQVRLISISKIGINRVAGAKDISFLVCRWRSDCC